MNLACRERRLFSSLRKLQLDDFHQRMGAKMVSFAGWSMPLVYEGCGTLESVTHTRRHASIFDVSHMLKTIFTGSDVGDKLEKHLLAAPLKGMRIGESKLSLLLNEQAGILDDAVVTKVDREAFRIVSNAGRADLVMPKYKAIGSLAFSIDDRPMIALQGPASAKILEMVIGEDLGFLLFMQSIIVVWDKRELIISRSGYTGEDGFEIIFPDTITAQMFIEAALDHGAKLAGLSARDILRIEAGLLLSGQDFNETLTPLEAGLLWTVGGKDRVIGENFIGSDALRQKMNEIPVKRLKGFKMATGPVPRFGAEIIDLEKQMAIGNVSSGAFSPTLDAVIAISYCNKDYKGAVGWKIRGQVHSGLSSAKLPFVPHNFYKIKK